MSIVDKPIGGGQAWKVHHGRRIAQLILSSGEASACQPADVEPSGFTIIPLEIDADEAIASERVKASEILFVELRPDSAPSMDRLLRLCRELPRARLVALVRDPSVQLVRQLMRSGVSDVLPLPLAHDDIAKAIRELARAPRAERTEDHGLGKVVTVVRSTSGVGATTLITQAAGIQASRDKAAGGATLVIDLDLQYGNVASYLGLTPSLTVEDLIESGPRLDRAMLLAACCETQGGARVLAAPQEIIPITDIDTDQILNLINLAKRDFRTILLDLPCDWTDWSLSAVGAADLIVLVIELNVASLRQARRQLNLLASQGLGNVPVMLVANRVQEHLFRTIDFSDAERILEHPVSFTIANDYELLSSAQDQGVQIGDIRSHSRISKNIASLLQGCDRTMGRTS